jgi:hypothetical protein
MLFPDNAQKKRSDVVWLGKIMALKIASNIIIVVSSTIIKPPIMARIKAYTHHLGHLKVSLSIKIKISPPLIHSYTPTKVKRMEKAASTSVTQLVHQSRENTHAASKQANKHHHLSISASGLPLAIQ